ncbi:MAG: hypothetical protein QF918_07790 [Pirellulaceae bacterium]|jgi:hypothetical protein|nr:hypothetical protein [Pirellulaceae bacterium]MDP6554729.1 hypothetical protein [Pirellulaceae bacterium]
MSNVATEYTIRRKVFTLIGGKFHIYNREGALVGFSKQKAFKLKEDIRVFTDESMQQPMLAIAARSIIDFSACYDVTDSKTGQKVGALRRKGMASMIRDEWDVLDPQDNPISKLREDSTSLALVRRFLPMGNLVPQHFVLGNDTNQFADMRTHFNPFIHRMTITVNADCPFHPLLVLAAAVLLVAIEGRQNN